MADFVQILLDGEARVLWLSVCSPPYKPEEVLGRYGWHFLAGDEATRYKAAAMTVLTERVPVVIDIDIPFLDRWRLSLFPVQLHEVRLSAICRRFPADVLGLSDRQRQLCRLIADGLSTKDIVARMDISRTTIDQCRHKISQRIGRSTATLNSWCGEVREFL